MPRRFALFVVAAMIGGILAGLVLNRTITDPAQLRQVADGLSIVTDIFLRLIRMIIAPLVFSTLVVGIAHMEDSAAIGRVGLKTLGWFVCASLVSLTIGLVMVHLLQPGTGLHLTTPAATAAAGISAQPLTLKDFVTHVFPTSIVKAMADNEILQIVVFSVFVGTAISAVEGRAPAVMALAEQAAQIMLKVTGYVMLFAPLAIFAALASTVATQGVGVLVGYARFVGGFYLSLALLWSLLIAVCYLAVGRRVWRLVGLMRDPALLAFSTASSEAAYPRILEGLQVFGVSRRLASFVLPLGYSFNLDGSMMYCTFATLFIAQAYHVPMNLGQQVIMLLVLMVTSKGMAGVPRASLVVIAATLSTFHLPEAGLLLVLAVDHLLDMGRSATNVVGNSVAATVIAAWEHELAEGELPEAAVASAASRPGPSAPSTGRPAE
ncbi:MAG: Proton/sodium-glutamate symport protein [Caulobacteraceae bacterium]|nr:Proton/sodium-glutamate symport protein [Caulobacteraceae bacterium]